MNNLETLQKQARGKFNEQHKLVLEQETPETGMPLTNFRDYLLPELISTAYLAGKEDAVEYIKLQVIHSGMSEGHDGEEPTGDWIYDLPESVLEQAKSL